MSTRSSSLIDPPSSSVDCEATRNSGAAALSNPRLMEMTKSLYQEDQQAKYLHLHTEVEALLAQLQTLKQQRLASVDADPNEQAQSS